MTSFVRRSTYEARPIGYGQYALLCDGVCVGVIRDNRDCESHTCVVPLRKEMDLITFAQRQFRTDRGFTWEGLTDLLHQRQIRLYYNGNYGSHIDAETMEKLA